MSSKAKTSPKKKAAKKAVKAPQARRFRPTLKVYRQMVEDIDALEQSAKDDSQLIDRLLKERDEWREKADELERQNNKAANLLDLAFSRTLERTPERQVEITEIIKNRLGYKIS